MSLPSEWNGFPAFPQLTYSYTEPMFRVTVSIVLFVEDRVAMLNSSINKHIYGFPTTVVKAGGETIQFAAVRKVKEATGIVLHKEALIPVDFRNIPKEYIDSMNVIDIGMTCLLDKFTLEDVTSKIPEKSSTRWLEVDFENKQIILEENNPLMNKQYYMDHKVLFERAIDVALMVK